MFRSAAAVLLLVACALAQSPLSPEVRHRIERQVRASSQPPADAQITIGAPVASKDWPGYDAVAVTIADSESSRTMQFLLSPDRNRLIYVRSFDLTQDPFQKIMRSIDLTGRPVRGTPGAPVTIVVFDDYQCPFCAKLYITLFNEVMNRYRDRVQVVLKDFPITAAHPWAMDAAVVANCLAAQNDAQYWKFSDYVHTHQQEMTQKWQASKDAFLQLALRQGIDSRLDGASLSSCVARRNTSVLDKSLAEGRALGISGTPVAFINGELFEGALTSDELRTAIDRALREAGAAGGEQSVMVK